MKMGDRIRTLREERGWSQEQLIVQAQRFAPKGQKIARETISRLENSHRKPALWTLQALAAALGTTADDLLGKPKSGGGNVVGGETGMTSPPELRSAIQQVGDLPSRERKRINRIMEQVLEFRKPTPEMAGLLRVLERMSPEQQAALQARLEGEMGQSDRDTRPPTPPEAPSVG